MWHLVWCKWISTVTNFHVGTEILGPNIHTSGIDDPQKAQWPTVVVRGADRLTELGKAPPEAEDIPWVFVQHRRVRWIPPNEQRSFHHRLLGTEWSTNISLMHHTAQKLSNTRDKPDHSEQPMLIEIRVRNSRWILHGFQNRKRITKYA